MIVVMRVDATSEDVEKVKKALDQNKVFYSESKTVSRVILSLAINQNEIEQLSLANFKGVEYLTSEWSNLPLAGINSEEKVIHTAAGFNFNNKEFLVIAGPCSVESKPQLFKIAEKVKSSGANFLRGGAFKPRTSPYSFQGLGVDGYKYLYEASKKYNLPVVSEVMSIKQIELAYDYIDVFQVGARNMYNYELLKELGKLDKPIVLKRSFSATIDEWLNAAEYILKEGNSEIILCERGIRTFSKEARNTLDINAIPILKKRTHLPIIVDPSHSTGHWWMVESMSLAALAAGADGIIVEVHNNPKNALSDGNQSLKTDRFSDLMHKIKKMSEILE
ncbi:MAG: 3-deoxy-7-phosphoheptulonate synthase [Clostridia bacterium]